MKFDFHTAADDVGDEPPDDLPPLAHRQPIHEVDHCADLSRVQVARQLLDVVAPFRACVVVERAQQVDQGARVALYAATVAQTAGSGDTVAAVEEDDRGAPPLLDDDVARGARRAHERARVVARVDVEDVGAGERAAEEEGGRVRERRHRGAARRRRQPRERRARRRARAACRVVKRGERASSGRGVVGVQGRVERRHELRARHRERRGRGRVDRDERVPRGRRDDRRQQQRRRRDGRRALEPVERGEQRLDVVARRVRVLQRARMLQGPVWKEVVNKVANARVDA